MTPELLLATYVSGPSGASQRAQDSLLHSAGPLPWLSAACVHIYACMVLYMLNETDSTLLGETAAGEASEAIRENRRARRRAYPPSD